MATSKITLQYICSGDGILRAMTFGGLDESTIKAFDEFEINLGYLRSKIGEMLGCLRSTATSAAAGTRNGGYRDKVREIGRDLYRELVPAFCRHKLQEYRGQDLLLAIDGNISWIPWELLHDGSGFLCRVYNMGRTISVPADSAGVRKRSLRLPVRHMIIADPEGTLPAASREGIATRDLLLGLGRSVVPVLLSGRVGETGFLDGLRGSEVLHFAGHLDGEGEEARVRLNDGSCSAGQIAKFSGRVHFPPLVFLNGCRSSVEAAPLEIEAGQHRAFGMARCFLFCGVRHFIGTLWDLADSTAAAAGTSFFHGLYTGLSVGAALKDTRLRLASGEGEHSMEWAGYVLYGDPSFRIPGIDPDSK